MLGHLLGLGGVRGIQAPAVRRGSGPGRDHAGRRAAGARVRQELGAVGGCSTHLGGEGKHNSRDFKKKKKGKRNSAEGTGLLAERSQRR